MLKHGGPRQAETMEEVEELWAPFKAKRQTRAQMAEEKGLEPLDPQMKDFWNKNLQEMT